MIKTEKMFSEPPDFSEHGFPSVARDLLQEPALPHPEGQEALFPRPNPEAVIHLGDTLRKIIFPGYLEAGSPDPDTLQKKIELEIQGLYNILVEQIHLSLPHECRLRGRLCNVCRDRSHDQASTFIRSLPVTQTLIYKDIQAAYEGDPAAKSYTEIILSYPGLLAITFYRLAHTLHSLGVPLLPRMMTEYANATILGGETVIGARSVIGGNVWLTESVPPDTKVLMNRPDLIYLKN